MATSDAICLVNGGQRAVFVPADGGGWRPDWFYCGERPMLRFKDHEWLSIGHVHPTVADEYEALPEGGAVFRGCHPYGQTPVRWAITVMPATGGGFVVECAIMPGAHIELLEAFSAFETPYEYDGTEHVTTVIGMNPVSSWHGATRLSPPIFENPAWVYSRPQAARHTAPCSVPYLCQTFTNAGAVADRFITIIGDWQVCQCHDIYASPTRTVAQDPAALFVNNAERKGFKYLVGALNWSSAFARDPNVLFASDRTHRQRVILDFTESIPGGSLDTMLYTAWERAAALFFPADGHVKAFDRAARRSVTWAAATGWLCEVFCREEATVDLFTPGRGICTYATGSRPKAGNEYSWTWWPQWAGLLHYRAWLLGDARLSDACARHDADFANALQRTHDPAQIGMSVVTLPSYWWIHGHGRGSALQTALRPALDSALARSVAENGGVREMDYGAQAAIAEAFLLGADIYSDPAFHAQATILLDEMATRLDDRFWEFNCGKTGSMVHGGQIRSMGHGHAVVAHLLAWRQTGHDVYLARARRFARYLLAINYACYNGSEDPDFDWRAWCNGSNAGRDQIAEFPPWETQNGLLCLASLLADADLEPGFCDTLWYIGRTGLAQFPAARRLKRILEPNMAVRFLPRETIASERDYYDVLPYLAYENPHDQTLQASYQGTDCLVGELVYGGGLVRAGDVRLGVFVPRAARLDPAEMAAHHVVLWNPTAKAIKTRLTAVWADEACEERVDVPPRQLIRLTMQRPG